MSSIASTMKEIDEREGVTSISANARIDYILRFSQHAVLVVDDDTELCTQIGNRFLGSLTKEHNAAYVSLSSKLNDIQIRCRIIEQLFGNTLFDPEQPLSVNVIKLSEANESVITIVVGNAEHMSLQLFHELCQLSETAKKLKKVVNVVFLGSIEAGQIIADNESLFDKKLSIIQANNGQLLSMNAAIFKSKTGNKLVTAFKVISIVMILGAIMALMFISDLWSDKKVAVEDTVITSKVDDATDQFIQIKKEDTLTTTPTETNTIEPSSLATSQEVFNLLMPKEATKPNEVVKEASKLVTPSSTEIIDNKTSSKKAEPTNKSNAVKVETYDLDENYFKSLNSGVVIQFASFAKLEGYNTFIQQYPNVELKGYVRQLNGIKSHIITSTVYSTHADAKLMISELPQDLRARGPWVKSIQAINNEINLYQDSK